MNANSQQSSNSITEKRREVQLIKPDILNYSHTSDEIGDIEENEVTDDTVKLSRSKRKLKIKINKGKKGSRKPRILDRLNTKKNRERLRDGLEEVVDDDEDYENFQTETPEQINLELIKAVKRSNLNKITEYIDKGADINTKDNNGKTPLHIASKRGYLDITKVLLDKGAKVDAQEDNGQEPIHLAAARGHLDVVKYLVEKGADVDAYQGGGGYSTVLHFAARKGHLDTVKYLIEKGANPDAKDGDGNTALERAEKRGILDIVEYLKDKVKQVTEVPQTTERQLNTTEMQNVTTNISQTTEELQVTTEIQHVTTNISQTTEVLNTTEGQQVTNGKDDTTIHTAAREGDLNAVKYFVENGTDVNLKDMYTGDTPLHVACTFNRLDIVKYLVEKGADVNIGAVRMILGLDLRNTPLHEAVYNGAYEIVKYLIENGADINATNTIMDTPLHIAAYEGYFDIAKYLIDNRANLRAINKKGDTPLHAAASSRHLGIVKYIADIDYYDWSTRADINAQNNDGETPLHIAARKGRLSIVTYLVKEKHAYTYRQDKNGNTPLHLAVKSNNLDVASFLVEQGPNLEIRNKDGKTPIDLSYTRRRRRDTLNNSWRNNNFINWVKHSISSTRSPDLLISAEHNNYTLTAVPEMNTNVINGTLILGILAAGLFNKTQSKYPIHGNLLSPRQKLMGNIDDSSRVLEQSLRKGKDKGWDIPNIDIENIEFSSNKTGNVEKQLM